MFSRLSRAAVSCVCLWFVAYQAAAAEIGKAKPLKTTDGVEFAVIGEKTDKPAPTLFIFALDTAGTLNDPTYRQAGNLLAKKGWLCVSLDLPCHATQHRDGEASQLKGWRQRIDAGEDLMEEFTGRAKKVLDHLIAEKYTDPNRVAACGTSRGGFSACHFAIAEPRVKCVAAYAPVADLGALREFRGAETSPLVKSLALANHVDQLAGRGVWIVIGDNDQRVDTDNVIEFARKLSAASVATKKLPRNIELYVTSVEGHSTPPDTAEKSAAWIEKILMAH
jgi:dienelactone hydrolase